MILLHFGFISWFSVSAVIAAAADFSPNGHGVAGGVAHGLFIKPVWGVSKPVSVLLAKAFHPHVQSEPLCCTDPGPEPFRNGTANIMWHAFMYLCTGLTIQVLFIINAPLFSLPLFFFTSLVLTFCFQWASTSEVSVCVCECVQISGSP